MQQIDERAQHAGATGDEGRWTPGKCRAVVASMTAFWAVLAALSLAVGA